MPGRELISSSLLRSGRGREPGGMTDVSKFPCANGQVPVDHPVHLNRTVFVVLMKERKGESSRERPRERVTTLCVGEPWWGGG